MEGEECGGASATMGDAVLNSARQLGGGWSCEGGHD